MADLPIEPDPGGDMRPTPGPGPTEPGGAASGPPESNASPPDGSAAATAGGSPIRWLASLTPAGRARVPVAWALYDFANTIFSIGVVSTAIGLWLTEDARFGQDTGQLILSVAVAVSVGINAIVSPILGALSDRVRRRLPFLFFFTAATILPCAFIGVSAPWLGVLLFTIANFSYQAALIYYDATLSEVSYPATRGKLSGLGVGIGYMGTIVTLLLLFFLDPPVEVIFLIVALLFSAFALPIFLVVREARAGGERLTAGEVIGSFGQLAVTIRDARAIPGMLRFLVGRFFYTDAVNTFIIVMAVLAVRAMGLSETQYYLLGLSVTVVTILASFGWGLLVDRIGPKRTLVFVLSSWAVGLVIGALAVGMPGTTLGVALLVLGGMILGSGLGGVWVSDRVFLIRLSPADKIGEFFGLYGLVGKASQVVGQLAYGVVVFLFLDTLGNGAYQLALLSLLVTMVIGLWLIRSVSDRWGEQPAGEAAPVTAG